MYKTGLIMGKFMPLHKGHMAMVEFGLRYVEQLMIMVVSKPEDPIDGKLRMQWLEKVYGSNPRIRIEYMHNTLPHDGAFRRDDVLAWCAYIEDRFPDLEAFISSESYGDLLAEYMAIKHLKYDPNRNENPVSATLIRQAPMKYLNQLPEPVQTYYRSLNRNKIEDR